MFPSICDLMQYSLPSISLTVCCLPLLGGEIPLRRLRPDMETFTLTLRVFDCVVFVQDLTMNLDKLASRSV